MKKSKKLLSVILAAMMLFCLVSSHMQIPVLADDNISADDVIGSEFADDKVLVVMNGARFI